MVIVMNVYVVFVVVGVVGVIVDVKCVWRNGKYSMCRNVFFGGDVKSRVGFGEGLVRL